MFIADGVIYDLNQGSSDILDSSGALVAGGGHDPPDAMALSPEVDQGTSDQAIFQDRQVVGAACRSARGLEGEALLTVRRCQLAAVLYWSRNCERLYRGLRRSLFCIPSFSPTVEACSVGFTRGSGC